MRNVNRWGLAAGLAAALALFGNARAQGSRGDTAASGTGSSSSAPGGTKIDQRLQDELERLHAANKGEISLAQLGLQNGHSSDVKQFAEKMKTDHQRADQQLTAAARAAGVASLDGKTFRKESDRGAKGLESLQSKTGTDFDEAFMGKMVKEHEKAVKGAQSAAQDARKANQTELAAYLDLARTGIQGHLDEAKQIQDSLGGRGNTVSSAPSGGVGGK